MNQNPPNEGTVGSALTSYIFTFSGPVCDSLGALTSPSSGSLSAADMVKVVPLYGASMRDSFNIMVSRFSLNRVISFDVVTFISDVT